ncbi:MAG: hypothetical protein E7A41_09480 [Bifidobacterium breve]|nr:hypothetical protein [Bifidobacterium breve]
MLVSRRGDTDESGRKGKAAICSAFIYGKRFAALRKLMACGLANRTLPTNDPRQARAMNIA